MAFLLFTFANNIVLYRNALYSIGLVLFLFILLINVILNVIIKGKDGGGNES